MVRCGWKQGGCEWRGVRWLVARVMPWSGQDGVRVERRWSEGEANIKQGFNGGWRRLHRLDTKNDAYLFKLVAFPTV